MRDLQLFLFRGIPLQAVPFGNLLQVGRCFFILFLGLQMFSQHRDIAQCRAALQQGIKIKDTFPGK